jgi:hypothetical protein
MRSAVAVALAAVTVVPAALAADVDESEFRYTRAVAVESAGPVIVEPDGLLFAHARGGLVDLRVLDARGGQVPWRALPPSEASEPEAVTILNRGRQGDVAVALLDLGPTRGVHDRIVVEIPDTNFVGRVIVSGSDRREGPFTRLSATGIYDVRGVARARSTTAVFPPTDFRYLQLRATNVSSIEAVLVTGAAQRPARVERSPRTTRTRQPGEQTIVTLDLGYRNLPVDELVIRAATTRYDRPVTIAGSNDGVRFTPLGGARIFRFPGSSTAPISLQAHHRYLRLTIDNGDDEPLRGVTAEPAARSRALLLEGGHPRPYRLLYGDLNGRVPEYDFARLPRSALELDRAVRGRMSAERVNPEFSTAEPARSFADEHPLVVQLSLALAALVVAFAGFRAFRSRAGERA